MAYLDKHSTLDPVMVSVVSSNPTGGNFLKFFKPLDVNFSLKCKCDLIVINSTTSHVGFWLFLESIEHDFKGHEDSGWQLNVDLAQLVRHWPADLEVLVSNLTGGNF